MKFEPLDLGVFETFDDAANYLEQAEAEFLNASILLASERGEKEVKISDLNVQDK